jgi:2-keto-4-pentenoate hydratase/2-oxohepta-3-ene-1,7-dioic acid hydratase in catechol pathway
MRFRCFGAAALSVALLVSLRAAAQTPVPATPDTPFKLATFEAQGKVRVGMVIKDRPDTIFDVSEAGAHLAREAKLAALPIPGEMRALIEQYGALSSRLYQIANHYQRAKLDGLGFAFDLAKVSLKAPIKYPYNLLAAAANYRSHAAEMGTDTGVDPDRDDPYFFAKSPRSCIVDPGTTYVIPEGRERIDWEGELAVVIGRPATRVRLDNALDHVFGFTIMFDVSDRGGATRAKPMFPGPDWFSGKSRDGAAPMGPFIVPKEFLPNHANLRILTKVNERVVQDGNSKDMIYDVPHQLRYITSIMTLYPGDVVSTGTPDGVGAGRKPPEFLKPGDVVSIEIEGIGKLVTPIQAGKTSTTP